MALAYTSCAGCSAAVKGLLQRPIEELRLVNAVVEECDGRGGCCGGGGGGGSRGGKGDLRLLGNGNSGGCRHCGGPSCGHGCGNQHAAGETASAGRSCSCTQGTSSSNVPGGLPRALSLREAYLTDRARLDQVGLARSFCVQLLFFSLVSPPRPFSSLYGAWFS